MSRTRPQTPIISNKDMSLNQVMKIYPSNDTKKAKPVKSRLYFGDSYEINADQKPSNIVIIN
jgi:hypothetical protein